MNESIRSKISNFDKSRNKNTQKSVGKNSVEPKNSSQSFFSVQNSLKGGSNENKLLQKLLRLQVDLMGRINGLKEEKIRALQEYNKQFDRFTTLSLQKNREVNRFQRQQTYQNCQRYEIFQPQEEEDKLKRVLQQLYQCRQVNNRQESKLNFQQLEELEKLIKLQSQSHLLAYPLLFDNPIRQSQTQILRKQNQLQSGTTIGEEIYLLNQSIQQVLSKKLARIQTHQQLLSAYQSESKSNVESMMRKKIFLQKQLQSINQILKQFQIRNKQKQYQQRPQITPHQLRFQSQQQGNLNGTLKTRGQKIRKYQELKSKLRELQKPIQNQKQMDGSQQSKISQAINGESKVRVLQELKQKQISETKQFHAITQLQEKLKTYESYLQNQNNNKLSLFKQIEKKKKQFQELKKQNQVMTEISKLIQ